MRTYSISKSVTTYLTNTSKKNRAGDAPATPQWRASSSRSSETTQYSKTDSHTEVVKNAAHYTQNCRQWSDYK